MALSNEQFDMIMRVLDERRRRARKLRAMRHDEVERKVPELLSLESASADEIQGFADGLGGGGDKAQDVLQRLKAIRDKKGELLRKAGFPADYLTDVYQCAECQDTGFVGPNKCKCFKQLEASVLYGESHLETLTKGMSFEELSERYYSEEDGSRARFVAAKKEAMRFADDFPGVRKNLIFMGSVGTGKTSLLVCIAKELLMKGYSILYFSASNLFARLSDARFSKRDDEESRSAESAVYGCDLLIIDDLGTEMTNSFTTEQLFLILNERAIREAPILISTNLCIEDLLSLYAERNMSRLVSGFGVVKLTGDDIRIRRRFETV